MQSTSKMKSLFAANAVQKMLFVVCVLCVCVCGVLLLLCVGGGGGGAMRACVCVFMTVQIWQQRVRFRSTVVYTNDGKVILFGPTQTLTLSLLASYCLCPKRRG